MTSPTSEQGPTLEARGGLLSRLVQRPVAVTMLLVAMSVFGFVSLDKLAVDLLPEISYPTLTVRTTWPGAAPEDVEERVSEKVQEALATLDDLVRSTSISRANASDVVLDFDWGTSMTFAVQDVREKLDGVFLPEGVERPLILRYDPNLDPILRIGIHAPSGSEDASAEERERDLIQLRWIAENRIKRELETIEGIAAVQVRGGLEEEIRVRLEPLKLSALRVEPAEVARRLAAENINASGGSLLEGSTEFLVRTVNQFANVEEIEALPIARRGAAVVRLSDLGSVERTHEKREVVSRIGGAESVEIAIYREAGANIVQLAQKVKEHVFGTTKQAATAERLKQEGRDHGAATSLAERAQVEFLAWRLRDEVKLETLSDQSVFIRDAVDDVKSSAIIGSILAVLVLWLFLRRLAATFIIGITIPISIVITFAPMFLADVSLNIMSLGGLALGVGMLVDNAIVLLESIERCREEGDGLAQAALRGSREVVGAVTASTLTTVSAFLPIVFVGGIAGQIFGDQALTVVASQIISLVVAVLFIPMLASQRWLAGGAGTALAAERLSAPGILRGLDWSLGSLLRSVLLVVGRSLLALAGILALLLGVLSRLAYRVCAPVLRIVAMPFEFVWTRLERVYPRVLGTATGHPWIVVTLSVALFWAALARIPSLAVELLPEIHQGEFTLHAKLAPGTPLVATEAVLREIDGRVRALPDVETTALTVGVEKETLTREIEGPHTARLTVRMTEGEHDPAREEALASDIRALFRGHPSVQSVEISRPTPFALEAPIAVEIRGYDLAVIERIGREVQARLSTLEGLRDVRSSVRAGNPEARVTFDREKMLELGLDLAQATTLVRDQVLGNVSTRFHEGDDRIDIRVIGDELVLSTLESVLDLPVNPSAMNPVPLRSVADVEIVQGPAEIRRIGNTRAVVVSAAREGFDLGGTATRIESELASLAPPEDVRIEMGGQKREMDASLGEMRFALILAVFLVYVVMACQFESLLQPLVILLSVPLAVIGVVFALDVLEVPLSVTVFIGLILLAGIVVNNAIVLIDRVNQQRAAGLSIEAAVLDAGRARLRPILMTTATSVLGLLPMTGWLAAVPYVGALGAGEGAELRAPMAIAVVAGMSVSTLLTLMVIPSIYALIEGWKERWRSA